MARSLLKATDGCGCPRGLENPLCPGAEEEAMNSLDQQEEAGATPTGGERGERNGRREGEKARQGPNAVQRKGWQRALLKKAHPCRVGPKLHRTEGTAKERGNKSREGKEKEKKRRSGERKEKGGAEANRPEAKPSAWSDGGHAVVYKGGC